MLEGMRGALSRGAVDLLEFEYHSVAYWDAAHRERRSLKDTLQWLHEAGGYTCCWQGENGCLAPASLPCWHDSFEFRKHSNLVCASRSPSSRELAPLSALMAISDSCNKRTDASS